MLISTFSIIPYLKKRLIKAARKIGEKLILRNSQQWNHVKKGLFSKKLLMSVTLFTFVNIKFDCGNLSVYY